MCSHQGFWPGGCSPPCVPEKLTCHLDKFLKLAPQEHALPADPWQLCLGVLLLFWTGFTFTLLQWHAGGFTVDTFTPAEPQEMSEPHRLLAAEQNKFWLVCRRQKFLENPELEEIKDKLGRKQEAINKSLFKVEGVLSQVSEETAASWHRWVLWSSGLSLVSSLQADLTMLIVCLHEHVLLVRNEPSYARKKTMAGRQRVREQAWDDCFPGLSPPTPHKHHH